MISIKQSKLNAKHTYKTASKLIGELKLKERLGLLGNCQFVGAYRYNLMCKPDIDIEVYSDTIDFASVVKVASDYTLESNVFSTTVRNYHNYSPIVSIPRCYYFELKYVFDNTLWNVSTWFLKPEDKLLIQDLEQDWFTKLTDKQRDIILYLKNNIPETNIKCKSVEIYRGVLLGKVDSIESFKKWISDISNS